MPTKWDFDNIESKHSLYSNIMNSIKLISRTDTIFMNSENSIKTSDPHRLILNHTK